MPEHPPRRPQALQWDDEHSATPEEAAALRELRRQFWLKIAPPFYDTRVVDYMPGGVYGHLDWD